LDAHKSFLYDFSWNDKLIASCSEDHTIKVWNSENAECQSILIGHNDYVNGISW